MPRVEAFALTVARALAVAGLLALIGFAAATLLDGVSRSLANAPITAVGDVGPFVVAAAIAACFPLAQLQRANIAIDLLGGVVGPLAGRAMRGFAALVVLVVMAAMARQMLLYAREASEGGDTTVMLGITTAPFWYAAAALLGCATLAQAVVASLAFGRDAHPGLDGR